MNTCAAESNFSLCGSAGCSTSAVDHQGHTNRHPVSFPLLFLAGLRSLASRIFSVLISWGQKGFLSHRAGRSLANVIPTFAIRRPASSFFPAGSARLNVAAQKFSKICGSAATRRPGCSGGYPPRFSGRCNFFITRRTQCEKTDSRFSPLEKSTRQHLAGQK